MRSKKQLNAIIDGNWNNFNEHFRHKDFSQSELDYMLKRELNGSRRSQMAVALHQRFSTIRNMNERVEIHKKCGASPI